MTSLLALCLGNSAGCNNQVYTPQSPFQSLKLTQDVRASVEFVITGPDGQPETVQSVQTLHAGGYYKMLSPEEMAAALARAKATTKSVK